MKTIQESKNKAFPPKGEPLTRSALNASSPPLFIDAREKEEVERESGWKRRSVCLLHGERFYWKRRCRRCRYLITFQMRLN